MNHPPLRQFAHTIFILLASLLVFAQAGADSALSVSASSVQIQVGGSATVNVYNASGTVTATSSAPTVATVTYASGKATINGLKAGTATVTIKDSKNSRQVAVTVVSGTLSVSPTSLQLQVGSSGVVTVSNASGTVYASSSTPTVATVTYASGKATVKGLKAGTATVVIRDSRTTKQVAVTVTASTAAGYSLLAWNNLGMHCVDGLDYSIFSILPPYNTLNAQLVDKATGKKVTSGVTLTYQSIADDTGSINTISSTKTNFWQYVLSLFGVSPAPDMGLAGYPMATTTPSAMKYNATNDWFEAEGIPITPYDDTKRKNFYPMVQVVAKNSSGQVLATAKAVLPVSDEMNCKACHSSTTSTDTALNAAKPKAGWVFDGDPLKDWKKNILRLHDEKQAGDATYANALAAKGFPKDLYSSAIGGKPVLCASCHASNALPGTGVQGISPLTQALHTKHSGVTDPVSKLSLDNIGNRTACYLCHPGSETQCLRGAMANVKDSSGNLSVNCQSCHGSMKAVGSATRIGWMSQPNCQACHHDGKREVSAVDSQGNLLVWADTRFATNPNTPDLGFSMYRFSKGHGDLKCESCHGSTHAEYPTTHASDNVQSIGLQGYTGPVRECATCHGTVPNTVNGGPHGMHTIGSQWISSHENAAKSSTAQCAYCHGADYRGSPLSVVKTAKSFNADGRLVSYIAGQKVSCYDCHDGPKGAFLQVGTTKFAAKGKGYYHGQMSWNTLDYLTISASRPKAGTRK
jgi:hypothetical protein